MIVTTFTVLCIDTTPPLKHTGWDHDFYFRDTSLSAFVRRRASLAYGLQGLNADHARLGGFGKRDAHGACTIAVMTPAPRQARQYTPDVFDTR
jgi:hypothetical protein